MTEQTNADLIAEARDFVQMGSGINVMEADRLIEELARELEAADQRAAQAEAELKDAYRTDIPSLKEQRDELAAVVEKVRAWTDRNKGTGYGTGTGASALEILDILATAPADALRELKAEAWDEGFDTALDDIGAADAAREHGEDQNPYRKEQS